MPTAWRLPLFPPVSASTVFTFAMYAVPTVLALGFLLPAPGPHGRQRSNDEIARFTAKQYVLRAYPLWQASHPQPCPASMLELNEYSNSKDTKDPWGRDYEMLCGVHAPDGAKQIAVFSRGPDGAAGTADDVMAWDLR